MDLAGGLNRVHVQRNSFGFHNRADLLRDRMWGGLLLTFAAININCAQPAGDVTVTGATANTYLFRLRATTYLRFNYIKFIPSLDISNAVIQTSDSAIDHIYLYQCAITVRSVAEPPAPGVRVTPSTAGSFAKAAITQVGPLTEKPFSAKAPSVPIARVRFSMKPAPSFSFARASSLSNDASSLVTSALNSVNSCKGSRVETYVAARLAIDNARLFARVTRRSQHLDSHDALGDLSLIEQPAAKGAAQQAAFDGRRQPFAFQLDHHVGRARLGYLAALVPQDHIIAIRPGGACPFKSQTMTSLVIQENIIAVNGMLG